MGRSGQQHTACWLKIIWKIHEIHMNIMETCVAMHCFFSQVTNELTRQLIECGRQSLDYLDSNDLRKKSLRPWIEVWWLLLPRPRQTWRIQKDWEPQVTGSFFFAMRFCHFVGWSVYWSGFTCCEVHRSHGSSWWWSKRSHLRGTDERIRINRMNGVVVGRCVMPVMFFFLCFCGLFGGV